MIDYNKYRYLIYTPGYDDPKSIIDISEVPRVKEGFVSTYIYDKSIKDYLKKNNGSLKYFSKTDPKVASNVFFVDFDDAKEQAGEFYKKLRQYGVGFKVFDSGGRSIHFHIKRDYVEPSVNLFKNDKLWVSHNIPGADTCLYECSRIFRLPNTVHHKTGKRKVLLEEVEGRCINIPNTYKVTAPQIKKSTYRKEGLFSESYLRSFMDGFTKGHRNRQAYQLIKLMQDYGCPSDFISTFIECCNEQSIVPMKEDELQELFNKHL